MSKPPYTTASEDKTPDDLHVKIYIKAYRRLMQEKGLKSSEVNHLLAIALRIDVENLAFPGNQRIAMDKSLKNSGWSRQMTRRLESKGIVETEVRADQSTLYFLPDDVFGVGRDPKSQRGSKPRGDSDSGGSRNPNGGESAFRGGGVGIPTPKYESSKPESIPETTSNNPYSNSSSAFPSRRNALSDDQQQAYQALKAAGVKAREAFLIAQQFWTETIWSVLHDASRLDSSIHNKGAWIRASIEKRAHQQVEYPNSNRNSSSSDPYLRDPYFQRQAQRELRDLVEQMSVAGQRPSPRYENEWFAVRQWLAERTNNPQAADIGLVQVIENQYELTFILRGDAGQRHWFNLPLAVKALRQRLGKKADVKWLED